MQSMKPKPLSSSDGIFGRKHEMMREKDEYFAFRTPSGKTNIILFFVKICNPSFHFKGSDRLCKVVERRICAQTQDLQIFKKFNMSQMNPKEVFHNTAYSVQLPCIAGHSL